MKRPRRQQRLWLVLALAAACNKPSSESSSSTAVAAAWTTTTAPSHRSRLTARSHNFALTAKMNKKDSTKRDANDDTEGNDGGDWFRGYFTSSKEEPEKEELSPEGAFGFFRRKSSGDQEKSDSNDKKQRDKQRRKVQKRQQEVAASNKRQLQQQQQQLQQQQQQRKGRAEKEIPKPGINLFGGGDKDPAASLVKMDEEKKKSKRGGGTQEDKPPSQVREKQKWGIPFFGGDRNDKDASISSDKKSTDTKSPSVLSAAQKFISSAFSGIGQREEWVTVVPKTRLSPGEIVPATVGGIDLLVIASKDGRKLYSIANSCPHLGTPLETGQLVRLPMVSTTPTSTAASESSSGNNSNNLPEKRNMFTELEVSRFLSQDGCEDCIVCPLHKTAFALESGQVRGEWCPYPPILGKLVGTIKSPTSVAVFDIRTRGKNIEVCINSMLQESPTSSGSG